MLALLKNKTHNLLSFIISFNIAFFKRVALYIISLPLSKPYSFSVKVVGWAISLIGWVACLKLYKRAGLLEVVVNS
jgi:hypothetical protein